MWIEFILDFIMAWIKKKSIQSHISGLSIMTSFCQENGHLKTASDVELTEITACDTTADLYLTN